nr:hypothetical protein [uncultured bacterium]
MSAEAVSAIASVASAVVSVIAVVIAARSARSAERSAEAANSTLRRSAIHELMNLCHDSVAENLRTHDLGANLHSQYTALFNLSGASGGSRETALKAQLDQDLEASDSLSKDAIALADDLDKPHDASNEDIEKKTIHIAKMRNRLRTFRESVELQLNQVNRELSERRR